MSQVVFDSNKAEAFGGRMMGVLNAAGLSLMAALGHRTGLFDAMAKAGPATPAALAAASGTNERYVREWLGAMACGAVVEYDPAAGTYRLPPEHAHFLTRSGPANLASSFQFISVLASAEEPVLEAFRTGRGVGYCAYHRFHEVMAEESGKTVVAALHDGILPLVPGLRDRLTAGVDVLDVGCGRGRAMTALARAFPRSRFAGYDVSDEATADARREAAGVPNVRFAASDLATIRDEAAFDVVFAFDAIHDQAKPAEVLRNVRRALKPGGVFVMQDISGSGRLEQDVSHPLGTFLYTVSCMHCMSVSLGNGGPGLGAMWGKETALRMLRTAGFADVAVNELPHDPMNFYYVARPG